MFLIKTNKQMVRETQIAGLEYGLPPHLYNRQAITWRFFYSCMACLPLHSRHPCKISAA